MHRCRAGAACRRIGCATSLETPDRVGLAKTANSYTRRARHGFRRLHTTTLRLTCPVDMMAVDLAANQDIRGHGEAVPAEGVDIGRASMTAIPVRTDQLPILRQEGVVLGDLGNVENPWIMDRAILRAVVEEEHRLTTQGGGRGIDHHWRSEGGGARVLHPGVRRWESRPVRLMTLTISAISFGARGRVAMARAASSDMRRRTREIEDATEEIALVTGTIEPEIGGETAVVPIEEAAVDGTGSGMANGVEMLTKGTVQSENAVEGGHQIRSTGATEKPQGTTSTLLKVSARLQMTLRILPIATLSRMSSRCSSLTSGTRKARILSKLRGTGLLLLVPRSRRRTKNQKRAARRSPSTLQAMPK